MTAGRAEAHDAAANVRFTKRMQDFRVGFTFLMRVSRQPLFSK
jgi:hypothetical protein